MTTVRSNNSEIVVSNAFCHETDFQRCNCCLPASRPECGYSVNEKGSARIRGGVGFDVSPPWPNALPASQLISPVGSVEKVGSVRFCVGLLSFGLSLHRLICSQVSLHTLSSVLSFKGVLLFIIQKLIIISVSNHRNYHLILEFVARVSYSPSFHDSKLNLKKKKNQ